MDGECVAFVKKAPVALSAATVAANVQVFSLGAAGDPLAALHAALAAVFCPILLESDEWSAQLAPGAGALLADLELSLRSTVRKRAHDSTEAAGDDVALDGELAAIQVPSDELDFWERARASRRLDGDLVHAVGAVLEPLRAAFAALDGLGWSEAAELVEQLRDALDAVWRAEGRGRGADYPQARMAHLLAVVGGAVARAAQHKLKHVAVWTAPYAAVRADLAQAAALCDRWCDVVVELTGVAWGRGAEGRAWAGVAHEDAFTRALGRRLEHVLAIRSTHEELQRLLRDEAGGADEAGAAAGGDAKGDDAPRAPATRLEAAFAGLNPILYNAYTDAAWVAAVADYEASLAPVEARIAASFRRRVAALLDAPQQMLHEFKRFRGLLARPHVRTALTREREALLHQLAEHLEHVSESFDAAVRDEARSAFACNLSDHVSGVVAARQIAARVADVVDGARDLFADLRGCADLEALGRELASRARKAEQELLHDWAREVKDALQGGEGGMRMRGQLMEIDRAGVLTVNYSSRLVQLLREVRQLTELGLAVPAKIAQAAAEGERYYRFGVTLKKVANFFNTMEAQILPAQRPMLLGALVAFEELVEKRSTRGGDVTWSTPAECEHYLRRAHDALGAAVAALMDVDMLRQRDLWKARWQAMQAHLRGLEQRYARDRMARWVLHWDHQVYKALEAAYRTGLETLDEALALPDSLRVELGFFAAPSSGTDTATAKALALRPPLEELRSVYYRELKKFVSIPSGFRGLDGANADVYQAMAGRNTAALVRVYHKAEGLFAKLAELQARYEPAAALARVSDLEALLEQHCTAAQQYEANFRALKAKRREADKFPDFVKVDCIRVSLAPLKAGLEEHFQRLGDALLTVLKRAVGDDLRDVDAFLLDAVDKLSARPQSVDDIAAAQRHWKELDGERPAPLTRTKTREEDVNELAALLVAHAASASSVDTSELVHKAAGLDGRWVQFDEQMEAFHEMIEIQKESLKARLEEAVMEHNQAIDKFADRWRALKPQAPAQGADDAAARAFWGAEAVAKTFSDLDGWKSQVDEFKLRADELVENYVSFNMPVPPRFDGLEGVERQVTATSASWSMLREYEAEMDVVAAKDWISFRNDMFALQDIASRWADKIKDYFKAQAALGDADGAAVLVHMSARLERVKAAAPTLKYCHGKDFKEEHWSRLLQGKLGLPREVKLETLTVAHFVACMDKLAEPALLPFVKQLQAQAQGEVLIREALQELAVWSQTAELILAHHEEAGRTTMLIKEWKDLFLELGDKQSLLASLKESQFYRAFEDVGSAYEAKLSNLDFILHSLNSIQRKWVYLEPIFGRGALPNEARRFRSVDEDFREIMAAVAQDPKLFGLVDPHAHRNIRATLETMLQQLERCQKALCDFLEEKRGAFPRFYFIGDDDLLEILGQAQNPAVIQSHLKKLFQGVSQVQFDAAKTQIVALVSSAGEVVPLDNPVKTSDRVEEWLATLTEEMQSTLANSLEAYLRKLVEGGADFEKFPSQVLCVGEQVRFADAVEAAMDEGFKPLLEKLRGQLELYTRQDLSSLPIMQLKVKALVMDLVHNMDVLDHLEAHRCRNASDWAWHKQLRYYAAAGRDDSACSTRMADATFAYTFEYQGNAGKLVHTPLTDKCYLTLTSGMHMGFGGNPYGPAGTGKTESVKALGAAFGRQVLVFNCDEGIDFQSMGRIFIGLVKCGAWGCFDEFNRLKEDQLSAISQQIQIIQDAIKTKAATLELMGQVIDVDVNAGIFVTLNPAGKDYGGRSQIPDNLKALFRPVAMGLPDTDMIAEVYLRSEGFTQARKLAVKVVSLFTLSAQLLTQQRHYDWGLRALKAILNTAGNLALQAKKAGVLNGKLEGELLIKAVRVNTLSKLTFGDTGRFLALIGDVFPGVDSSDMAGGDVEAAIRVAMRSKVFSLQVDEAQIRKMLQLKEALDQRMGCVVVGPSGCGKSTVWRVLQAALQACGQAVKTYVMNPKSMPRTQLLGEMDLDTREWSDGVLTDAARKVVKEPDEVRSWIVCDGDVDPEWIESLNSVLDDNHLLTLPNGERIAFGDNVNFLFETHDLRFASPATVSRMGMIFLSDEDIDVRRVCCKWLDSNYGAAAGGDVDDANDASQERQHMEGWLDDLFYRALQHVNRLDAWVVETTLVGTVMNALSSVLGAGSKAAFVCGLVRGLGGNLPVQERVAFAKQLFEWAQERPPDLSAPLDCAADARTGVLYSFAAHCGGVSQADDAFAGAPTLDAVINTVSTQRGMAMLAPWVASSEPFILVGPEGCGKNMMIRHAFAQRRKTAVAVLHCNAQTTAEHVIAKIAQCCSLFSAPEGRVYRPRDCERLVLYLKDLNLPRPDMYDTCMLIAFLQQVITFGGFYDKALEFLRVDHVQIVASMNPATTVGRHPLSTRFTATVRVGVLDYPDSGELTAVYAELLEIAFAEAVNKGGAAVADNLRDFTRPGDRAKLAATMVEIYERVKATFTVDDRRHYLFTPRDITAWVKALLRYDLANEELLNVVAYEGSRLFRDRLVSADAEARLDQLVNGILRARWKFVPSLAECYFTTLGSGVIGRKGEKAQNEEPPLLQRLGAEQFLACVTRGQEYYERENSELKMLLFAEILDHVARVDRVLSCPGGNLLLVGRSGVGRRTAAQLVAYMRGCEFHAPSVTRAATDDDAVKHFRAELKPILAQLVVEGCDAVLYVEDHHFQCAAVLELVNSLLSAGEVPGLYAGDELEALLAQLREVMLDEGTDLAPYDFYLARVKRLLHVCVAMDPTNPLFALRCESNPALFTACTILWMGDWRRASMRQLPLMVDGVKQLDDELVEALVTMHESAGGASPREFVLLLHNWSMLHDRMRGGIRTKLKNLGLGIAKLEEAASTVDHLSRNAEVEAAKLTIAQQSADAAMEMITKTLSEASGRRSEVSELTAEVKEQDASTMARKAEIEQELSSIQPVLETAKAAVGLIKAEHLNEIRSLKMPPEPIADVLGAVLKLLGISDVSWSSMKKFLSNRGVKDEILHYDARRIGGELRKDVARLLKQKASSFDHATITRVSVAAAPLAAWVKANIRYSVVLEKIQPLEAELAKAEESLEKCQQRLRLCEDEISTIDERVAGLKVEFGERTGEAEKLKRNMEHAKGILGKAEMLLGKLGGEQARWKHQAGELRAELASLPRQLLLAAGFLTYLPRQPEDVRERTTKAWAQLVGLHKFSFTGLLATESQLLAWKQLGLPADSLSQENALVVTHAGRGRVPFVIDPANASRTWLLAHFADDASKPLEAMQSADPRFTNQVELAVRFGKTLLIFDVDGLEPMLYPLARLDVAMHGPRAVVRMGDKYVDFNENFRLALVTRNPRPNLPPDAAALVSEIDFTVTRSGLEGQLLGATIQHEQPALELQKTAMLKQEEDYKIKLAALEKNLLEALATAEGDLLENTVLIESLTETKATSKEIQDALSASGDASAELDRQREGYRSFARDGSALFFLVRDLVEANPMYQYSLASFVRLFEAALRDAAVAADAPLAERLARLTPLLVRTVFFFVGRGLFKADQCMFALHVVHGMHPNQFRDREWALFTGDAAAAADDGKDARGAALPGWAAADRAPSYAALEAALPQLARALDLSNATRWGRWAKSPECEREFPPEALREATPFQRLLVVRTFRPDRLLSAMKAFACEALQVPSLAPPPLSFDELWRSETRAGAPTLLITTAGADPSKELADFAAAAVGAGRFKSLAMGGGTHARALALLGEAAREGTWLCLQNLHLVVAWLPTLEKTLGAIGDDADAGFRLWLTTEPHAAFPRVLLQQSLKVTFESPPGTKKNMQRTLTSWGRDFFERGSASGTSAELLGRRKLLFVLAWFHAVTQERRTYLPQGWTKGYEFGVGDLRAGAFVMEAACCAGKAGEPDFTLLRGLMEDAIYGGRVDDKYDLRVLRVYLGRLFCPDVFDGRADLSRGLAVPASDDACSYAAAVAAVARIPDKDAPTLLGLPDNVERSVQRRASMIVQGQLRRLTTVAAAAVGFDRELWRAKLGPLIEQWATLVQQCPALGGKGARAAAPAAGAAEDPIVAFVSMENEMAATIAALVDASLAALKRVVYGTALLTPAASQAAVALIGGRVPSAWAKGWQGPERPAAWVGGLAAKTAALATWDARARSGALLQQPLRLTDVFRPSTFLNALRQLTARTAKCSMDELVLVSAWSQARVGAAVSVVADGLLLQGAELRGTDLVEAAPDAAEFVAVPPLALGFAVRDAANPRGAAHGKLVVPVYIDASREQHLVDVEMDIPDGGKDAGPATWILAGVAMFLSDEG
ncbi:dynein heavy chain and region D6 of dynein motor-domain-containing protein [Pelagophyceae sp. CCMP2097]|nr:dynein heavy chain and region D6 of dynein motor-domain-containing protein [Pelagophyceae sp. CCMP2097]